MKAVLFFFGQSFLLRVTMNFTVLPKQISCTKLLHGFMKLRRLLKKSRMFKFHANWKLYLMLLIPALRFEVLHSSVSLIRCKDRNLLAIRSFSGWNDFILWKKNPKIVKCASKSKFFLNLYKLKRRPAGNMTFSLTFLHIFVRTGGVIITLLPIQDDKGRAAFHGHYRKVGGRRLRWSVHIRLSGFVLGEVIEGRCDWARFVWFLACLVDDMRGFGTEGRRDLLEFYMTRNAKPPACTKFSALFCCYLDLPT